MNNLSRKSKTQGRKNKSNNHGDPTYTRWRAAIHEASHAVVHASNNIEVKWVKVTKKSNHWLGYTKTATQPRVDTFSPVETDIAVACGMLAGHAGEALHAAPVPPHINLDEILTATMIGMSLEQHKNTPTNLFILTTEILQRNSVTLIKLANKLMHENVIRGTKLDKLLKEVK